MRAKPHDIQWPVVPKTVEDINTNFDTLFDALNAFERTVASSKSLHEILSAVHSDSVTANRIRGDILTAQGTNPKWTRLAKGTSGFVLTMGANDPAWAAHNVLSATHGDTLLGTVVRGDVIIGNATPKWSRLAKGTSGFVLTAGASDVSWATPAHALLSATHTDALAATVVRGDVLIGNATPVWSRLAKGTATYVLTADATDVSWAAIPTQTSALLSAVHTDTTPAAVVQGDLIIGSGASPTWTRLAKGTAGYVLTMGADEPAWATPAAPVAHQLDGALHTVSGLTPGHFLKALTATTFGFAAHGLAYGDVGAAAASHGHAWADITSGVPTTWTPIAHDILSAYHGDSTAAAVVRGDLIIGSGATPKWTRLAIGTAGYLLKAGANEPAWGTLASTDLSDTTNLARLNAVNTFLAFGYHTWSAGGTGGNVLDVRNTTDGTANYSQLRLGNDATPALFICSALASSWTPSGTDLPSGAVFKATGVGGLSIGATDAAGDIRFYAGGSTLGMIFDHHSRLGIGISGSPATQLDVFGDGTAHVLIGYVGYATWCGISLNGSIAAGDYNFMGQSGQPLLINRPAGQAISFRENNAVQLVLLAGGLGAFAAGDKYLIVDASGNLHVSTLGPLA